MGLRDDVVRRLRTLPDRARQLAERARALLTPVRDQASPETIDLWGKRVEVASQRRWSIEPDSHASVDSAFLTLNDIYLQLVASPLVATGDQHVQQEPCYQAVLAEFQRSGLAMEDYAMDPAAFERYLADNLDLYRAPLDYAASQGGLDGYFPQKALEHWISAAYLGWGPLQRVLDFAAWISPATVVLARHRAADFYKHDITLTTDLAQKQVAGFSDAIEAPDAYFDFIMAHCAIDNFEGDYDTHFFREAARILKPGGKLLITPLHMSARYENRVAIGGKGLTLDADANLVVGSPGTLRFARLYSVAALSARVIRPTPQLDFRVIHVRGLPLQQHPATCTNRFMLLATRR